WAVPAPSRLEASEVRGVVSSCEGRPLSSTAPEQAARKKAASRMDKWTPALPRARDGTTAMERTRSDTGLVVHRNGLNDQLLDLEILELDLPEDAGMVQNEGLDEAVATLGPQDLNLVHPHSLFACRPEKALRILADSDPEIQQVRILRCLGTEGQHAAPAPAAADDVHGVHG